MALFFSAASYKNGPLFFNKKYMHDPIFQDSYVKGPIFLTSWYIHIFFAQRFFEAACSLGIQWIDCDICLTTSTGFFFKRLIWNFNIVNISQSMHVASSFNWAFSGSLFGLGRKREFRCFSPVSENHSYSRRNRMFCSHHDGILTSEH